MRSQPENLRNSVVSIMRSARSTLLQTGEDDNHLDGLETVPDPKRNFVLIVAGKSSGLPLIKN